MTNGTLAIVFIFGGGMLVALIGVVAHSGIGQSIADAIRHNSGAGAGAEARELEQLRTEVEQIRGELEEVRNQLLESHERLDFAERLLAQRNDQPALPVNRAPA